MRIFIKSKPYFIEILDSATIMPYVFELVSVTKHNPVVYSLITIFMTNAIFRILTSIQYSVEAMNICLWEFYFMYITKGFLRTAYPLGYKLSLQFIFTVFVAMLRMQLLYSAFFLQKCA